MALLEEVRHWRQTLWFQKPHAMPVFPFYFLSIGRDVSSDVPAVMPASMLPYLDGDGLTCLEP